MLLQTTRVLLIDDGYLQKEIAWGCSTMRPEATQISHQDQPNRPKLSSLGAHDWMISWDLFTWMDCFSVHAYTYTHTHTHICKHVHIKYQFRGKKKWHMNFLNTVSSSPGSWLGGEWKSKPPSNDLHYKKVPVTQDVAMHPTSKDCNQHLWSLT